MANISYRAASSMTNRYGYNGGNEYEDEGELNYSNTFYRKYDAQIGRFTGVDMLAEKFAFINPYQYGYNNPVMFNVPKGDKLTLPGRPIKGPDGNYHTGWVSEMMWGNLGFFSNEYLGGGGGGGGNNFTNIRGWSSQSILSQMSFGQSFGKNKRGEYGFWQIVQGRNFNDGFKIRGNDGFVALTYENNIELSHKEWTALRGIQMTVGNVPIGTAVTFDYPDMNNQTQYLIPTYSLDVKGTDASGRRISKSFEVIRFGVNTLRNGNIAMVGLANAQSYRIQNWISTYSVHSASSTETGAWQVNGNYLIHDGPDNPMSEMYATAGCIEVCGGPNGFVTFNNFLLSLSGASSLSQLGSSGTMSIKYLPATRPPIRIY